MTLSKFIELYNEKMNFTALNFNSINLLWKITEEGKAQTQ